MTGITPPSKREQPSEYREPACHRWKSRTEDKARAPCGPGRLAAAAGHGRLGRRARARGGAGERERPAIVCHVRRAGSRAGMGRTTAAPQQTDRLRRSSIGPTDSRRTRVYADTPVSLNTRAKSARPLTLQATPEAPENMTTTKG